MAQTLVTGNYAAGYALARAGEANRRARGCVAGAYPITPQTEIIETLRAFPFTKGRVIPVESEHSAMGACIGAALCGARSFTASSSNGLAYMVENVYAAGFYRLPVVMIAVNRTLGPPWNIWVDQGDSLMLRDTGWIQFYVDSHQDLVDTILLAFRVAEDARILLPVLVCLDGFVLSHTQMVVDLFEQEQVDRYLPPCNIPHQLRVDHPAAIGGLTWPRESEFERRQMQAAMERVPAVLEEALDEFEAIFKRRPVGALSVESVEEAETVLIASSTMATTARQAVRKRREAGDSVGLIRCKMFRPFPREALVSALQSASHIGVLDRNISPGSGGVFGQELAAALNGRLDAIVQDYMIGLCGGDVTPLDIERVLDDLEQRVAAGEPCWQEIGA